MEEFKVPKLYLANQAVMSLFASGRTTGTIFDSGYGKTHSVPIFDGYPVPNAIQTIPFAGSHLSSYLFNILPKSSKEFRSM